MATMIMWVGGLLGIEPNIRIRKLISNRKDLNAKLPAQLCIYNKDRNWDDVEFRFLQSALDYFPENNNSCVLQIRSKVAASHSRAISRVRQMRISREAMAGNSRVRCYLLYIMKA